MSGAAKPPAGAAGIGALDGTFPDSLSLGAWPATGLGIVDDFVGTAASPYGQLGWVAVSGGTPGGAIAQLTGTSTNDHECGLLSFTVNDATTGSYRLIHLGTTTARPFRACPPVGSLLMVKIRHTGTTTDPVLWVGVGEFTNIRPIIGNDCDFVGFRSVTGGNWEACQRNGIAEDVADTGVAPSTSADAYAQLWMRRTSATAWSFGTFVETTGGLGGVKLTTVGTITGNVPDEPLTPMVGTYTDNAVTCGFVIDYYALVGRVRRTS